MITPKIKITDSNDQFHEEVYPRVWLMDDHKWAFWAWLNHFVQYPNQIPAQLLHFDHHWDAVNDFQTEYALSDLNQDSHPELFRLVSENYIRKDGFIAPAIIKGFFDKIHFYCKQRDTLIGFQNEFLNEYGAKQFVHNTLESINNICITEPYAFDLDIDLFNDSGMYLESKLWNEAQIDEFFSECAFLIQNASIVTIAMSFGYSGTKEDTKWLGQYVVSKIVKIKRNYNTMI